VGRRRGPTPWADAVGRRRGPTPWADAVGRRRGPTPWALLAATQLFVFQELTAML
jgi:hypothetical protein